MKSVHRSESHSSNRKPSRPALFSLRSRYVAVFNRSALGTQYSLAFRYKPKATQTIATGCHESRHALLAKRRWRQGQSEPEAYPLKLLHVAMISFIFLCAV